VDIASGLFALGGVFLAGLLTEVRSRREWRSKKVDNLIELRRLLYARALREIELAGSRCTRWIEAEDKSGAAEKFWDAMTEAYQTLIEVRLVSHTIEIVPQMDRILHIYQDFVEEGVHGKEPSIRSELATLVDLFRRDLGTP
jgi:hypothetical protein